MSGHRKKYRGLYVYGIDGDHLNLPASNNVLENKYKGIQIKLNIETHYPRMYTTQVVDLISGMVKDIAYSTTCDEIHQARKLVKNLEQNSLTIYDRNHSHYHSVKAHFEAKNFFLIRAQTQSFGVQKEIKEFHLSSKRSGTVTLRANRDELRLKSMPELKVRIIKIKKKYSNEDILLITNLPSKFSNNEVGRLYGKRWEIETSFRDLTHNLELGRWHSKSINGILQEIYALLWFVNTIRFQLLKTVQKKWLHRGYLKSNFLLTCTLFVQHLDLFARQRCRALMKILDYWIYRTSEKRTRLKRTYPRQVRYYGKNYKSAGLIPLRT